MTELQRASIYQSVFNSDIYASYWANLCRIYAKWDSGMKLLVAILSSSTVASWTLWQQCPNLWKTLSAVSALTAILQSNLHVQEKFKTSLGLHTRWQELHEEYQQLWDGLEEAQEKVALSTYSKLKKEEVRLSPLGVELAYNQRLFLKCYNAVMKEHGLDSNEANVATQKSEA